MSRQLGVFLYHLDRGGNGAAIGVAKHHDERHAEELHGIFEAREAVVIDEIAGEAHDEDIAGPLIEQRARATRGCRSSSRIAAIGYCAATRSARPTE